MTILALAVGADRVLLLQDAGTFERDPPQAQTGVTSKITVLPHARFVAGGCGSVAMLSAWRQQLMAGVAGDSLAEVAQYGPGLLRGLANGAHAVIVVGGLDASGRAGGLLFQASRQFVAERLNPGLVLHVPDTREPVEPVELVDLAPPAASGLADPEPPAWPPPDPNADWTDLRLRLFRGVRKQIEQHKVPFALPIISATLHPDGIDLRELRP